MVFYPRRGRILPNGSPTFRIARPGEYNRESQTVSPRHVREMWHFLTGAALADIEWLAQNCTCGYDSYIIMPEDLDYLFGTLLDSVSVESNSLRRLYTCTNDLSRFIHTLDLDQYELFLRQLWGKWMECQSSRPAERREEIINGGQDIIAAIQNKNSERKAKYAREHSEQSSQQEG
jgi:hypothetical protein